MKSKLERDIQTEIMLALGSRPGVRVFRLNVGLGHTARGAVVRFGLPGMADLLVCTGAKYLWLECKSKSGSLRPAQRNFRDTIRAIGGAYAVVRSVDEALAALEEVQRA